MPLGRYFAFTTSVLLALLFAIDWYFPKSVIDTASADVDRSTIRIYSRHKWPSAVVFDTNQPTIVPPPVAVAAEAPAAKSPRDALAMAQLPEAAVPHVPVVQPKHVTRRVKAVRAPAPARVANYEAFSFQRPFPAGW